MVLALTPHRVVEDAERLQCLAQRASAETRNARKRLGNVGEPALFGGGSVALDEAKHGLDGEDRVFEELNALGIILGAAAGEARAHLGEAGVESVADGRREVGGEVEDDTLLAERGAGGATRGHLLLRVEVGDLANGAGKGDALAVEERGGLAFGAEHFLQADAGARLVGRALGDEARQKRRPVDVAAEAVLATVEGEVEQGLNAGCHGVISGN